MKKWLTCKENSIQEINGLQYCNNCGLEVFGLGGCKNNQFNIS